MIVADLSSLVAVYGDKPALDRPPSRNGFIKCHVVYLTFQLSNLIRY